MSEAYEDIFDLVAPGHEVSFYRDSEGRWRVDLDWQSGEGATPAEAVRDLLSPPFLAEPLTRETT